MGELLDGDLLAVLAIAGRDHRAVRALADQLYSLVLDRQLEHNSLEVCTGEAWDVRRYGDAKSLLLGSAARLGVTCRV